MSGFEGKVALITGASAGIGASTALLFASRGCFLSLMARNKEALDNVAKACCEKGLPCDKVLVVAGDVSVEEDVAAAVERTVNHFGKLDILVNNAGIFVAGRTETLTLEQLDSVWNVNLRGALCMMRQALPHLRLTKGSIVNVSSAATSVVVPNLTPYSMTKAALDHLTRCAAFENAPYGVRVNAVNPAVTRTTLMMPPDANADEYIKILNSEAGSAHALGRIGTPEEIAHCIAFLASEEASFVTGITMLVDGGLGLVSSLSGPKPWNK